MHWDELGRNLNYAAAVVLMLTGLYAVIARPNLVKKVMGLMLMQSSLVLFLVTLGIVGSGGTRVVVPGFRASKLINPVPQTMALLAMVVAMGGFMLALGICLRIYAERRTLDYRTLTRLGRD